MDSLNRISAANTIYQFLSELNPAIALIVYANSFRNLDVTINMAKSIEAGYKIIQRNVQQQSNHALQQLAPEKDSMKVLTATLKSCYDKRKKKSTLPLGLKKASMLGAGDAMKLATFKRI